MTDCDIVLKRIYSPEEETDGTRFLVDRLWPRGKRREDLAIDDWHADAAPSAGVRQCWHRGELTIDAFRHAYRHELDQHPECLTPLLQAARKGRLTLLTASRDPAKSHLPVLRQALKDALDAEDQAAADEPASPTCYEQGER